jgi:hypothetical protein
MMTAALSFALLGAPVTKPIEVPFRMTDEAMIVDARVNGKDCSFMFDTGFSGAFVLDSAINLGPATGTMNLRDFVGQFEASTIDVKSLSIGALKVDAKDMTIVAQPSGRMSESYGLHCDGIMGLETVANYVTEINFEKSKFIFYPDSYDISSRKPDGVTTFLQKLKLKGNNSIELAVEAKNGKKLSLALDTGNAFYATTHKDKLEQIDLWEPGKKPQFMRTAFVASGAVDSWYKLMTDMKIFGVPVKESVWSIIDLPSSSADHDGTVGFGFLKNFNITIDMKRRRVWMQKFAPHAEAPPVADIGVYIGYDPTSKASYIFQVTPNSPAERAGIRRGDKVLSINGKEPDDLSAKAMMNLLEGAKGTKVALTLSRAGELKRYDVPREFMINGVPTDYAPARPASAPSTGQ